MKVTVEINDAYTEAFTDTVACVPMGDASPYKNLNLVAGDSVETMASAVLDDIGLNATAILTQRTGKTRDAAFAGMDKTHEELSLRMVTALAALTEDPSKEDVTSALVQMVELAEAKVAAMAAGKR